MRGIRDQDKWRKEEGTEAAEVAHHILLLLLFVIYTIKDVTDNVNAYLYSVISVQ